MFREFDLPGGGDEFAGAAAATVSSQSNTLLTGAQNYGENHASQFEMQVLPAGGGAAAAAAAAAPAPPAGWRPPPPPAALPPNWTEYFNEEGVPYYYNSVTGATEWLRPAGVGPSTSYLAAPLPAAI